MKTHQIVTGAAFAALLIGVGAMALAGGLDQEGGRAGASLTARWAFVWFIAAWSASSLAKLWPGGWRTMLLRRRRAVGLGFAASHFVHLGFVLTTVFVFGAERSVMTFVGGGLGYLLIALMALTSNDASMRRLGWRWKALHSFGGFYVLLIFFNSYLGRLLGEKPLVGAFGVSLIAVAVALRIAAFAKGRMRLQAA